MLELDSPHHLLTILEMLAMLVEILGSRQTKGFSMGTNMVALVFLQLVQLVCVRVATAVVVLAIALQTALVSCTPRDSHQEGAMSAGHPLAQVLEARLVSAINAINSDTGQGTVLV